jgi:hypothetical protein
VSFEGDFVESGKRVVWIKMVILGAVVMDYKMAVVNGGSGHIFIFLRFQ